ncbi:MAG: bleomycin resistance protein [Janthinobacterium lividum]|uniref:bleomycin resistance protein n=1 Tax=Pseudomonas sp. MWU16-30317 TaxID=2878095 RepID=UPI001CFAC562|nr:VOC family protein [Pseudomonas sp. MWU16-30317]
MLVRNKLVPELIITDLSKSLYFWTELLGFTIAYDRPEEGFAYLDLLGVQIMLEERRPAARQWLTDDLLAPFGRGVNFQIEVPDVDAILERLGKVRWPLFMACEEKWYRAGEREVGQRQFLVQDPDGYLVRLAQDLGERAL